MRKLKDINFIKLGFNLNSHTAWRRTWISYIPYHPHIHTHTHTCHHHHHHKTIHWNRVRYYELLSGTWIFVYQSLILSFSYIGTYLYIYMYCTCIHSYVHMYTYIYIATTRTHICTCISYNGKYRNCTYFHLYYRFSMCIVYNIVAFVI